MKWVRAAPGVLLCLSQEWQWQSLVPGRDKQSLSPSSAWETWASWQPLWMDGAALGGRATARETSIKWTSDFPVIPTGAGKSCLLCRGIQIHHAGNGCLYQTLYLPSSQFKIVLSVFCFPLICFVQFPLTQITRLSFSSIFQSSCAKSLQLFPNTWSEFAFS